MVFRPASVHFFVMPVMREGSIPTRPAVLWRLRPTYGRPAVRVTQRGNGNSILCFTLCCTCVVRRTAPWSSNVVVRTEMQIRNRQHPKYDRAPAFASSTSSLLAATTAPDQPDPGLMLTRLFHCCEFQNHRVVCHLRVIFVSVFVQSSFHPGRVCRCVWSAGMAARASPCHSTAALAPRTHRFFVSERRRVPRSRREHPMPDEHQHVPSGLITGNSRAPPLISA